MSGIGLPPGIQTAGGVGFGGINVDALQNEWAINFATISACNGATKALESQLQYYNHKMTEINSYINQVNAVIPSDTNGKEKYFQLPKALVNQIKDLGIAMPVPQPVTNKDKGGYSVSQLNAIVSSLNNKLNQENTDSQAVAQNASAMTNYINTASTNMSSLIAAMSQAMTYPSGS